MTDPIANSLIYPTDLKFILPGWRECYIVSERDYNGNVTLRGLSGSVESAKNMAEYHAECTLDWDQSIMGSCATKDGRYIITLQEIVP